MNCSRLAGAAALLLMPAMVAHALPWDKDMVDQPSIKPQEALVVEPEGSVPVSGKESIARPADVGQLVMSRMTSASLPNPEAASEASVARGEEVYAVHCAVCHGASGIGDGMVGKKFVPPPMDLTNAYVQQQADGQLFFTITHGSVVMPFYRDAIEPEDRWHLVNYMKNGLVKP